MHDFPILITLSGGLALALVFGWITQRLGLSTLVGYMIAGIIAGPHTPGFVADTKLATEMAEIGVILLMFGVGMHFHPQELIRVWRIAVPGAVVQSTVATVAGWALARSFGWDHSAGLVFGMALSVASTVVLMRMLVDQNRLSSRDGHVAVGWLIVEDLFTVVALVVLPALAVEQTSAGAVFASLGLALGKAALFAALVWLVGNRFVSPIMERIARAHSTELFTLTVFVIALGVAMLAAEVFHVSVALGAFFAGLVVGQSRFGPQATADMAPFRDVFSALFFVSIGMLFDPRVVLEQPWILLASLGIVLIAKPLAALAIVALLRDTRRTALTVAVGLSQIGEFSFILASLGRALGVLPDEGLGILVVAAILSIALNPLLFRITPWIEARLDARRAARGLAPVEETPLVAAPPPVSAEPHGEGPIVIVTGLGKVGGRFVRRCAEAGLSLSAIDQAVERVEEVRGLDNPDISAVYGDAGREDVLAAAGVAEARVLVVTNTALPDKMRICMTARAINPRIAIIATANTPAERGWLQEFGATSVCDLYDEMSEALLRSVRTSL